MPSISISCPLSLSQMYPHPLKELAVSVPGPAPGQMEGAEPGGRGRRALPVSWTGGAPAPPVEDPVSVYNIYMYVLFPVLYGPCPLSGRPHKSSPQSLPAWFLDSLEVGRVKDAVGPLVPRSTWCKRYQNLSEKSSGEFQK
jgi:hypothetical protein